MRISIFFLTLCVLFVVVPGAAEAHTFMLQSQEGGAKVGDVIWVDVMLDTDGETINALSGTILVPDFLSFVRSEDKNSLVTLWVQKPAYTQGAVSFEGVIPGGIFTDGGQLTRLFFEVIAQGQGTLSFTEASVYLHDGLGTKVAGAQKGFHLAVTEGAPTRSLRPLSDSESPEPFTLTLLQDSDIHEGAPSLVFYAHDKDSGISHFTIREGHFSRFKEVVSPYKLLSAPGTKEITVRAYDSAGNVETAVIYPQETLHYFTQTRVIFSILGVLFVCLMFFLSGTSRYFSLSYVLRSVRHT